MVVYCCNTPRAGLGSCRYPRAAEGKDDLAVGSEVRSQGIEGLLVIRRRVSVSLQHDWKRSRKSKGSNVGNGCCYLELALAWARTQ